MGDITLNNPASQFLDIVARKPAGWLGKKMYQDPKGHYRSFNLVLNKLSLQKDDVYLEIGCGGGVLLDNALESVSQAMAIDLSPDMVALAREKNQAALAQGRLEIVEGNAESLPWPDECVTCIGSANVFFFVQNPITLLQEAHRVLQPGGRIVIATQPKAPWMWLIGKLFAMNLYSSQEMESMILSAGFSRAEAQTIGLVDQICYGEK